MNIRIQLLAAGVAVGSCCCAPALAAPKAPLFDNWAHRPEPADYQTAMAGLRIPDGVRVVMRCHVEDSGALSGCRLIQELPAATGAGPAFLAMAPQFVRKPPGKNDLRDVNVVFDYHPVDTAPDWVKRPTADDLRAVWPTTAWKQGLGGKAAINCLVTVQGTLNQCVAVEETPGGFGGAAVALTPQFLMRPAMRKGAPAVSDVQIPIAFQAPGAPPNDDDMFGTRRVIPANLPWSSAPSYADVVAAYPKKAREAKVSGHVMVECSMSEEGRLAHCSTVVAQPQGYDFDDAAKALARQFQFPVRSDADRKATHGLSVQLPVTFDPAMLDQATRPIVGKPSWAALPSADEVNTAFKAVSVSGTVRAQLNCAVLAGGGLGDCQVVSETPLGAGVGAAAMSLSPTFRITTWTAEGLPTIGGRITVPIRYEGGAPAPATPAAK